MKRDRAAELRWNAVDSICDLALRLEEQGEQISDEDERYLRALAKRVAQCLNVKNHLAAY